MLRTTAGGTPHAMRVLPKDIGVALVVLVALGLGLLLRLQTEGRSTTFQAAEAPFSITYPAWWGALEPEEGTLLSVEDPLAASTFKTTLTVEQRLLDPSDVPALQTLVDRRVEERATLTGYHFLDRGDATVDGAPAAVIEYAYVVQPIDQPGRAALPVVVHAREYIVVAGESTYYITLAAPEAEFADASARFDRMLQTVKVR
ncbi:MAG TPA: hypothetical protein VNL77_07920 [Roseiflexaceae bacterium]|nr:hypothetical protein [Roseiflexaceae bacterium]